MQQLNLDINIPSIPQSNLTLIASDEAYTNWDSIALVNEVLGKIDIDPCTEKTNRLNAKTYFTIEQDALTQACWNPDAIDSATCFMNPPYSRGNQKAFLEKLIEQIEKEYIAEAIVLTLDGILHNQGTRHLAAKATVIAMAGGLKFVDSTNNYIGTSNPRDHVFLYFGDNPDKFNDVFGRTYLVCSPTKSALIQKINITPVPKPRMTRSDKWNRRPCVLKYRKFKDELKSAIQELPPSFRVVFGIPMPKSWSEKKRKKMLGQKHQNRPDLDNLEKALLDAIEAEDGFIYSIHGVKKWASEGYIELREL